MSIYDDRYRDAGWMAQLALCGVWFGFLRESTARALLALGDSRSLAMASFVRAGVGFPALIAGFWLGGVPGLIGGSVLAAASSYYVLSRSLAARGIRTFRRDLRGDTIVVRAMQPVRLLP